MAAASSTQQWTALGCLGVEKLQLLAHRIESAMSCACLRASGCVECISLCSICYLVPCLDFPPHDSRQEGTALAHLRVGGGCGLKLIDRLAYG